MIIFFSLLLLNPKEAPRHFYLSMSTVRSASVHNIRWLIIPPKWDANLAGVRATAAAESSTNITTLSYKGGEIVEKLNGGKAKKYL